MGSIQLTFTQVVSEDACARMRNSDCVSHGLDDARAAVVGIATLGFAGNNVLKLKYRRLERGGAPRASVCHARGESVFSVGDRGGVARFRGHSGEGEAETRVTR